MLLYLEGEFYMLTNKVAVVTGGTRGIGFATVEKFLENNAKVILLGSKKESVDKALSKLKEKGYEADGFYPSLTNINEVKETFDEIVKKYGKIDILVNNAGMSAMDKIYDYNEEDFYKIIDLNVRDYESRLDYYLPWIICFSEKHPDDFKKIISFLKTAGYTTAETEFDIRLLSPVMMLSENIDREIPSPQEEKTEKKTSQKQRLIVAGSYSKKENADAVLKDLEMQGFSGKIREISQNGKTFFRIYVLPIENDFTKTVSFLKQMEIDAFTVNDVY